MTFYKSQRWHSGEKRGFRLNVRRVAAAAAFASAEHFQSENALANELSGHFPNQGISFPIKSFWKKQLFRNVLRAALFCALPEDISHSKRRSDATVLLIYSTTIFIEQFHFEIALAAAGADARAE
ncbi:hypothetical protein [Desulfovibrio sp. ZJ369]|uniref:hypothetical protein n=1 Tax=Desulfovibrio sp. ZJ369 TaxID=2709793 RepID=UPI0013EB1769|nr:hypothetical protein [Desulfovibrio sp. ZJ369]